MHLPVLISDLAIMLLTAGVVSVIFKRINQPAVLGYILAGFLIGPYMPLFFTVADTASISTWSEIGIIALMFSLGLEFNLHKLVQVGMTGVITAITEVAGMMLCGFIAGKAMGWPIMDSIFLGGMLSMSSTAIIIKAFDELDVRENKFAGLVFGTLVVEDIAGIFMMIVLSAASVSRDISGFALAGKLALMALYLAVWLLLGIYILPTFISRLSKFMNDETLLIMSLGICFGMVLLGDFLGFSSALGAFLAGSLLAGTVQAERVEKLSRGIKDLFGAVFFLSVGMLVNPSMIVEYLLPIIIISFVAIFGKLLFSTLGVLLSGNSLKNAVQCGCSLAQIGEFAFIIAALGMSLGVTSDSLYPIIICVSVITTFTTPFFIKGSEKIYGFIAKLLPEKLVSKLSRYTDDNQEKMSRTGDWGIYLQRYLKVTALYSVIMIGVVLIGVKLLQPALRDLLGAEAPYKLICLAFIYFLLAMFTAPMLDTMSPQFTTLWVRSRKNRLPLSALTVLRVLLIMLFMFIPAQSICRVSSIWFIPVLAVAVVLFSRSGWLASRYIALEARFLANFNERSLQDYSTGESAGEWLDDTLQVLAFEYYGPSGTLESLDWGRTYGINVIKIVRRQKHYNLPGAGMKVKNGDMIYVLGEAAPLHALRAGLGIEETQAPTLRQFIETESDAANDIYVYMIPVDKDSEISGKTVKDCGLRENYECMILGLQRNRLPIAHPDVNMEIVPGDMVWIMGAKAMADRLILKDM